MPVKSNDCPQYAHTTNYLIKTRFLGVVPVIDSVVLVRKHFIYSHSRCPRRAEPVFPVLVEIPFEKDILGKELSD